MGKRARKRGLTAPPPARRRGTRPTRDDLPPAPWHPVPLVEICVLIAIACLVVGFFSGGDRSGLLIACGLALGSLAGLEVVIREHFAGFKSHTTVLALAPAVAAMAIVFFSGAPQWLIPAVGAPLFVFGFWALRGAFLRRSGGVGMR